MTPSFKGTFLGLIIILALWSLYWKGRALWTAAKKDDKPWFIALLLINTVGLLELYYLFIHNKKR